MDNIYKQAAIRNLAFLTNKGPLTVSDLFQLPLTSSTGKVNLNDLARSAYQEANQNQEPDFVGTERVANSDAELSLEILKDVIATLKEQRNANAIAEQKKAARQKIMALIEQKQDESLGAKSLEELQSLLESM
jgi:hypothetical protein